MSISIAFISILEPLLELLQCRYNYVYRSRAIAPYRVAEYRGRLVLVVVAYNLPLSRRFTLLQNNNQSTHYQNT